MKVLEETFKRPSFISDEPSDMIKKEVKSSEDLKKLAAVKQDRNVYKNRQAGDKIQRVKMDQDLKSVYRKVKLKIGDSSNEPGRPFGEAEKMCCRT